MVALIAGGLFAGYQMGNKTDTQNSGRSSNAPAGSVSQDTQSVNKTESSTTTVNLADTGLRSVGADIYGKTNTTHLILSNNSIKTLPSEMGKMTILVELRLDHNQLEGSLIGEVRLMSQLQQLDVSHNKMTGMPAEIGQLSKLEALNYSYNNIEGLPNEIVNLKNNLKEFNLTGNPLSQAVITKLRNDLPNTVILF